MIEVNIVEWVKVQIPEDKAQQFYEAFEKMYGPGWITFDVHSLFALKETVMNTIKLRRRDA
jgi:hypothetical protein